VKAKTKRGERDESKACGRAGAATPGAVAREALRSRAARWERLREVLGHGQSWVLQVCQHLFCLLLPAANNNILVERTTAGKKSGRNSTRATPAGEGAWLQSLGPGPDVWSHVAQTPSKFETALFFLRFFFSSFLFPLPPAPCLLPTAPALAPGRWPMW